MREVKAENARNFVPLKRDGWWRVGWFWVDSGMK
jgi:hypothetical protein